MILRRFENSHPALACFVYLLLWVAISAAFLWPFSKRRVLDRLPICLAVVIEFLAAAIAILPLTTPHQFQHFLGHSLQTISTIHESGGTVLSEPWLERWQEATYGAAFWVSAVGALWAIVNLFRRRAWITNTVAVAWVVVIWFIGQLFVM